MVRSRAGRGPEVREGPQRRDSAWNATWMRSNQTPRSPLALEEIAGLEYEQAIKARAEQAGKVPTSQRDENLGPGQCPKRTGRSLPAGKTTGRSSVRILSRIRR